MSMTDASTYSTGIERPLGQLVPIVKSLTATLRGVLDIAERYEAEHHGIIAAIYEERGEISDAMDTSISEETGWRDFYNAVCDLGELCGIVDRTAAEASHAMILQHLEQEQGE